MSILAEALAVQTSTRKGPRCQTGLLVDSLPADQAADLEEAFASDITSAAIGRALKALGHHVPTTLARHRRGECACGRK